MPEHPWVGHGAVYRDPYKPAAEQGVITSVNQRAGLVFIRFGQGCTSACCTVDERMSFLDGTPMTLEALRTPTTPPATQG